MQWRHRGGSRGIALPTHDLSATWEWAGNATPLLLYPWQTQYPLYRRLGGPWDQSGWVWKISPPPGFKPWILQPIMSHYTKKLHRLSLLRVAGNIKNYIIYGGQKLMVLQLKCGGKGLTTPHEKYKHVTICYTQHPDFQDWIPQRDLENMAFQFHQRWRISWPIEQLLAFQGLWSTQSVTYLITWRYRELQTCALCFRQKKQKAEHTLLMLK